jgi:glycosyltransferase involved in cell wall biosynthesis
MIDRPLISVIIPAHNNADTIATAIESIARQTYRNLEILVIDDNSTDATRTIVEELGKKYHSCNVFYYALPFDDPNRVNSRGRNVNAGYSARNYGFTKAHGEWITFQDADDASLLNRIEVQYHMALEHDAIHVSVDWFPFDEANLGKKLDIDAVIAEHPDYLIGKKTLARLARKTKGVAMLLPRAIRSRIPFEAKRMRIINKLFFRSLAPYPCAGNTPLFRREVLSRVQFRASDERVWPTFVGRGADRDFDFEVAETFKRSIALRLPLYMWRAKDPNPAWSDIERYLA